MSSALFSMSTVTVSVLLSYNLQDTVVSRECCNVLCKCTGHEGARGNQGPSGFKVISKSSIIDL